MLGLLTALIVFDATGQTSGSADANQLFAKGFEALKAGNATDATKAFEAGLKKDPKNALAWFYLGEAKLASSPKEAASDYKKSLALDPTSRVADAAKARLDALNGSPSAASPSTAKAKPDAEKDPASITLDSGITLADWEQFAVNELKEHRQDKVLKQGAVYRNNYGNVAHLDGILARALQDKLETIKVDDEASATAALPTLEQLSADYPNSLATVTLNRAKAQVTFGAAKKLHRAGDFDGALKGYADTLKLLPQGDPLRAQVVKIIQIATDHTQLLPLPGETFKDCADCPEMVVIPAGSFLMGSADDDHEKPQHNVTINSFAAGRYAVTRGQFAAFVQAKGYVTKAEKGDGCKVWTGREWKKDRRYNWRNVGFSQSDDHPVVCVSWNDAKAYTQWISEATGKGYRLLSESEREYAARGGTTGKYWWGDTASRDYANYGTDECCGLYNGKFTTPGGKYPANPFGLYDMSGNTWDWVEDWYHGNYNGAPNDGSAWVNGGDQEYRMLRGGSWLFSPREMLSSLRFKATSDHASYEFGFRLARTLVTP